MSQCVVYNASYEPLGVVDAERGLLLCLLGRAHIKEEHPELRFRTVKESYPWPTQIVLKEYRKSGGRYYRAAELSQKNLFTRDEFTCQYCRRPLAKLQRGESLTRDHVTPLSRGGKDEWTNVVTACSTCNHRKDNHTQEEILELVVQLEAVLQSATEAGRAKQAKQLEKQLEGLRPLLTTVHPKEPTVFEIMMRRAMRHRG